MGKIDDMRRHREALFAQRQGTAAAPATDAALPAPDAEADAAEAAPASRRARRLGGGAAVASERGTCSGCGKVRPVHAGIIAVHQKGLGAVCPGSRKPPA